MHENMIPMMTSLSEGTGKACDKKRVIEAQFYQMWLGKNIKGDTAGMPFLPLGLGHHALSAINTEAWNKIATYKHPDRGCSQIG